MHFNMFLSGIVADPLSLGCVCDGTLAKKISLIFLELFIFEQECILNI